MTKPKAAEPVEDQTPTAGDEPRVEQASAKAPSSSTEKSESAEEEWSYSDPPAILRTRIQRGLGRAKYYRGPANGIWDEPTRKSVQAATESKGGYSGSDDGDLNNQRNVHAILVYAKNQGGYAGAIDDRLDSAAWASFAVGLEKE